MMKPIKFPAADATRTTHILRTGRNLPRPFVDKARTAAEQMTPSLERDALEAALSGVSIAPVPKAASKKPKDGSTDATSGNTGNADAASVGNPGKASSANSVSASRSGDAKG